MTTMHYWDRLGQSRLTRRRLLSGAAVAGAGAVGLSLVGCGGGGSDKGGGSDQAQINPSDVVYNWQLPDESANARDGGIHQSYTSTDITGTLDPTTTPSFSTLLVAGVAYEPLLIANSGPGIDPASAEGRKIIGGLAESWEVSADAAQFTFKLRPNVKFHAVAPVNGRVMDIEDWRVTLERTMGTSPTTGSPLLKAALNEAIEKVEYPDSKTMVMKMKSPNVPFLRLLTVGSSSFYVVPKEIATNADALSAQPAGTNYRVLSKFQPSIGREYKRHVDFWRGKPLIEQWLVPIIPEVANQRAQFITGNIISYLSPQTDVLVLRKDYPKAYMRKADPAGSYRLNFFGHKEFETSPWGDARVRIAMRMGVDWKAVRDHFSSAPEFAAAGVPIESRMPTHIKSGGSGYAWWLNPEENKLGDVSKNFLFNAAEAKKLLSAAGHANGFDIDGFMNGGTEYGTSVYPELVQVTADQWKQNLNINVKINRPPYASDFLPNIYTKRDFKGIAMQQPEFTYNEVDQEMFNWFHSRGSRYKSFPDSKVDDFIERQRKESDDSKRAQIIADFQKYMAEKMYAIPGDGVSGTFFFNQPWYRNVSSPAYKEWVDDKSKYA